MRNLPAALQGAVCAGGGSLDTAIAAAAADSRCGTGPRTASSKQKHLLWLAHECPCWPVDLPDVSIHGSVLLAAAAIASSSGHANVKLQQLLACQRTQHLLVRTLQLWGSMSHGHLHACTHVQQTSRRALTYSKLIDDDQWQCDGPA